MKKTVKVVAAIIENDRNEILCALRSPDMSLPNMWEFPEAKLIWLNRENLSSVKWVPTDIPAVEQLFNEK